MFHDNWIIQRVAELTEFEALQFFDKLSHCYLLNPLTANVPII